MALRASALDARQLATCLYGLHGVPRATDPQLLGALVEALAAKAAGMSSEGFTAQARVADGAGPGKLDFLDHRIGCFLFDWIMKFVVFVQLDEKL